MSYYFALCQIARLLLAVFNYACNKITQSRPVNSYLYMNKHLVMNAHPAYGLFAKVLQVFFLNNCTITERENYSL
jgi:hypothetical protein